MNYTERFQLIDAQGRTLTLEYPYALDTINGVNLPSTKDRTTRSPFQAGDTYLGAMTEPRVIDITLVVKGRTRGELGQMRRHLASRVNAKATPLQFRALLEDGARFRLRNVSCIGPIQGAISYEGDALAQKLGLRLVAHDTIWYSDELHTVTLEAGETEQLTFPVTLGPGGNLFFGAYAVTGLVDLHNQGDWDAAPFIRIPVPVDNPKIINQTTHETIALQYSVSAGEIVYIDTTPGARRVYNNYGVDLKKYLLGGDFATFHLEPDSIVAPNGHNFLVLLGATPGILIQGSVSWYDRFTSI
uniref:Putative tail protein n=1 Tax=viral metagenome TaxID=1070528 RepID=A0A6M3J3J5_9ZZZZ